MNDDNGMPWLLIKMNAAVKEASVIACFSDEEVARVARKAMTEREICDSVTYTVGRIEINSDEKRVAITVCNE